MLIVYEINKHLDRIDHGQSISVTALWYCESSVMRAFLLEYSKYLSGIKESMSPILFGLKFTKRVRKYSDIT